jgi:hypothetical protein
MPVAHSCNPSYSEVRDRKIVVWSQPRKTVHKTLSGKKPITKKRGEGADGVAQGVGPEFKLQYHKKNKKEEPGAGGTPIILATQEVEIRRIAIRSQPGQKVC